MTLPGPSLGMSPAEHLRARIAAAPKQGLGRRRYGAELKRAVVEYAFTRQGEHATIHVIAEQRKKSPRWPMPSSLMSLPIPASAWSTSRRSSACQPPS